MPSAEASRENGKKGGRPTGALQKMSQAKARELASKDETPLDVMIDNMLFWRRKAAELTAVAEEKVKLINSSNDPEAIGKLLGDFTKTARQMLAAREESQKCAVDAAPYVHPKFTSISVKNQITNVKIQMAVAAAITQTVADDDVKKITNGHAAVAS